jgi:hypothetical protein
MTPLRRIAIGRTRDGGNREDLKSYPGGMLMIAAAGSPASLKSRPIKYALCDEFECRTPDIGILTS